MTVPTRAAAPKVMPTVVLAPESAGGGVVVNGAGVDVTGVAAEQFTRSGHFVRSTLTDRRKQSGVPP